MIPEVRFVILSIAFGVVLAWPAAGADQSAFRPGPAAEYAHQNSEQVIVGAKPFNTEELIAAAFGKKVDLLKYGVLPVLVVIENKREQSLDLREIEVSLVAFDGRHATSVNPEDIPFIGTAGKHPSQSPVPLPVPLPKKKNPLNSPEIVTRAFSAKMLPPGDSAAGFFYFEARPEAGDRLYLNGVRDARSGKDVMYFEFPLDR